MQTLTHPSPEKIGLIRNWVTALKHPNNSNRTLVLCGDRRSGKTTIAHAIEAATGKTMINVHNADGFTANPTKTIALLDMANPVDLARVEDMITRTREFGTFAVIITCQGIKEGETVYTVEENDLTVIDLPVIELGQLFDCEQVRDALATAFDDGGSLKARALEAAQPLQARHEETLAKQIADDARHQMTFAKHHFKEVLGVEIEDENITPDNAFSEPGEEKPRILYEMMHFRAGYFSHNARLQFGRECRKCGKYEWQNIGDIGALGFAMQKPQQCSECDENRTKQATRNRYLTAEAVRNDIDNDFALSRVPTDSLIAYFHARAITEQTDAINEAAAATHEVLSEILDVLKPRVEIALQPDPLTREKMNDFLKSTGLPTMPSLYNAPAEKGDEWQLKITDKCDHLLVSLYNADEPFESRAFCFRDNQQLLSFDDELAPEWVFAEVHKYLVQDNL